MLPAHERVNSRRVGQLRVFLPVDTRVNHRGGPAPVFVRRVRIENLRDRIRLAGSFQNAIVGEWRDVSWIKRIQKWMSISRRLREAFVEASEAAPGYMRQNAVEHLPPL